MSLTMKKRPSQRLITFFSLFASGGTLLCCALPALLVSLGAGAVVAGAAANFPFLVVLSENKIFVFTLAAALLVTAGTMQWRARNLPCPIDQEEAKVCSSTRFLSRRLYFISIAIFVVGACFAFVLPRL